MMQALMLFAGFLLGFFWDTSLHHASSPSVTEGAQIEQEKILDPIGIVSDLSLDALILSHRL